MSGQDTEDRETAGSAGGYAAPARWEWDQAAGRGLFSPHWETLLDLPAGSAAAAVSLQPLYDQMHEDDLVLFREDLAAVTSGSRPGLDIPVRMRRRDNTWAWILLQGKALPPEEGPGRVAGIALEISRLRLDKRFFPPTFGDSLSSFQSLLDNSPNFIMRCDRELFPFYINPALERLVGCKLGDLGSKRSLEVGLDPAYLAFLHEHVNNVFATGETHRTRRTILTRSGPLVGEFCLWPEFSEDGATVRTVMVQIQDLTSQVRQGHLLRLNEMRASALYDLSQMHDASEEELMGFVARQIALLTGSEYGHIYIPQSRLHDQGYTLWAVDNRSSREPGDPFIWKESHPGGLEKNYGRKATVCNDPEAVPSRYFFGDKSTVSRYMFAPALEKGAVACVAAVYNKAADYEEEDLRQLERFINGAWPVLRRQGYVDALEKAKESAVRANAVKDRFLANVSHELRTPLNGLLGMLQIIASSENLAPELREYVHNANLTGRTLLRIISDILDFSRMQAGALVLDIAPFDLRQTLTSTMEIFRNEAEKKRLALDCVLEGEFPSRLRGDEARVRQILFNLLGNALKFTHQGGICLRCAMQPPARGEKRRLHLSVSDTGIGIPRKMQAAVFDAFTQIQTAGVRRHQGTGLGLGIVRQLAEQMGGSVSLESLPGKGTTVYCTICLEAVPEKRPLSSARKTSRTKEKEENQPPLVILVAEDDRVSQVAMRLFLQRQGHSVFCVENGRQALEALLLYPFDCLISDVLMPEMDGLELTRRIRQGLWNGVIPGPALRKALPGGLPDRGAPPWSIPADLPIVSASAHAMHGDREHFLRAGMDFYLSKPLNATELARVLACVVARRSGRSETPPPAQA
ncbi:MAG: response regulator [Desulfovibrio sp.]|jgi:signal transduction histidine kinase/CheY-like chemotaxis protein/PAS domain-containing protein|nr:response regulator [Desulfovibrio sp.]